MPVVRGGVTEMSLGKRTVPSFMAGGGGGGGAGAAHAHNNGASTSDADLDVGPSMGYDAEAAEAENDRVAGQLGDRVRLLRSITKDIHDEVESQNRLLDNLGGGMDSVRAAIGGTIDRVTRAFATKENRLLLYVAGGTALVLFVLYYAMRGSSS